MSGQTFPKTSSGLFHLSLSSSLVRYFILFITGAVAIFIHARLKLHLGIPGHQGLIYMALLVGTCVPLNMRYAAIAFTMGSSALLGLNLLGFSNPFIATEYLFLGFIADILLNLSKSKNHRVFYILLIGALGYGMIPAVRIIVSNITGYPFGSFLKYGFALTFLSHITFGMIGSATGFGISKIFRKKQ